MSTTSALVLEILEAALSCDDERALRLAEEAGCTRFELATLRFRMADRDACPADDWQAMDECWREGHEEGWKAGRDEAIHEAIQALVDAEQSVWAIDALMVKFGRVAS